MHQGEMFGIILLTFGALNAVLALSVGTCTQGSADGLYGGFLTVILYVGGLLALTARPPSRWANLCLIPAAGIAIWHSFFAAHFMWGYWAHGMSACYAIKGGFTPDEAGEWMDGGEPLLTLLWATASVTFWAATATGFRLSAQAPTSSADE